MSYILAGLAGFALGIVSLYALELRGAKSWIFLIGMVMFAYLIKAI